MFRVMARAALPFLAAMLALAGCNPDPCPAPDAHRALSAQLLFGRALHGGGEVTDAQWRAFLADTVTPRFPDGLTWLDGNGQWRSSAHLGAGQIVTERSIVMLIIADDTPRTRQSLDEIRAAYRARFAQDSVGLVTAAVCAAF
jgi:hypothetical protein